MKSRSFSVAGMGGLRAGASEADVAFARAALAARGGAAVPDNFETTAPGPSGRPGHMPQAAQRSPQTAAFLELLDLPYNLEPAPAQLGCSCAPDTAPGLVPGRPAGVDAAALGKVRHSSLPVLSVVLCLVWFSQYAAGPNWHPSSGHARMSAALQFLCFLATSCIHWLTSNAHHAMLVSAKYEGYTSLLCAFLQRATRRRLC